MTGTGSVNGPKLSRAQRAADATTEFSGSWKFVIGLSLITVIWVAYNQGNRAFDPYPWLMFNSILTVVSTFQSPLIMMSQNRQIDRDKQSAAAQADLDRQLVQGLHAKLDKLLESPMRRHGDMNELRTIDYGALVHAAKIRSGE